LYKSNQNFLKKACIIEIIYVIKTTATTPTTRISHSKPRLDAHQFIKKYINNIGTDASINALKKNKK